MAHRYVRKVIHSNENVKMLSGFLAVVLTLLFALFILGHFLYRWF